MKQRIAIYVAAVLAVGAIALSQYRKDEAPVSSAPIFHLIGDTEQELTRLPASFTRISDEDEIQIGDRLVKGYAGDWEEQIRHSNDYQDAQLYVEQVGARVSAHARRKLPYRFHYIPDQNFVNAFALPGGHVFIGQGLMQLMDSEDELAAVLGHEVEHIDLRHCAERVQLEARLRELHLGDLEALAAIPYAVFAAGYSKEQELAADENGTELAVNAGYSPNGALRMFQTFEQFEPEYRKANTPGEELSGMAAESLQEYFRTHPRSSERTAQIRQLIATQQWPPAAERDLRTGYIALTAKAKSALRRYDYEKAIGFSTHSLKLKPAQASALEVLYAASMYTGEFAAASDAAQKLCQQDQSSLAYAQDFAEALAAQRLGAAAVTHYREIAMSTTRPPESQLQFEVEAVGLSLLAGDESPMRDLVLRANSLSPKPAGEILERVGRWYYLAGKYDEALQRLASAQELYPGQAETSVALGWAALQNNRMQTAQSAFQTSPSPEALAGLAIGEWRMEDRDRAVLVALQLSEDSRWRNERWVSVFYGPTSFRSLTEIETERQRRMRAKK